MKKNWGDHGSPISFKRSVSALGHQSLLSMRQVNFYL